MSLEQFPKSKGNAEMSDLDQTRLQERIDRAISYKDKYPGTGSKDAANAVLNTDYRGNLSDEKRRERNAYLRAMLRGLSQPTN